MLRYLPLVLSMLLTLVFIGLGLRVHTLFYGVALIITGPLALLGIWDVLQTRHSILRNYPILAHIRYFFEDVRPEFRQYLFESDTSGTPFNREQRSLVYQRAKNTEDKMPFGTELDVYERRYSWLNHSTAPVVKHDDGCRITIGGDQCSQPYSASVLNISAMSFGALSANAIRALNSGASKGNFAHDTGEGSISRYHREHGGALIWEIGTGYFGCRNDDGSFNADMFAAQARTDQVRMIEIKLSQGAKPGHGGVLPGAKVTPEIAATRKVPVATDCISPAGHSAFSTPVEMLQFIAQLRELSGGKPTGFKLCIGHPWEFMAMVKAMLKTGILPDFIVINGAEGGTGAAPVEFSNHLGTPLRAGLQFVHNTLRGADLRDKIRIGASGKIVSAYDMVAAMTLGADWCNSARGFMFAVGCVQSQSCHTNKCPVGVATQDPARQRGLVVPDKAERVFHFHRNTISALLELLAAAGLQHPGELRPWHFYVWGGRGSVTSGLDATTWLERGELLSGSSHHHYALNWDLASADSFRAQQ